MPEWYEGTKFLAQLLCSVNSAINPFITFRITFFQMYRRFQNKRIQKKALKNLKKKTLVITPPTVNHQNCVIRKLSSSIINRDCEVVNDVANISQIPDGQITPMSGLRTSPSGTPSRRAASLSKHVLMKYTPSYFDVNKNI